MEKVGGVGRKNIFRRNTKTSIQEYWDNGTIPWMSSGEVNLETIWKTEKFIDRKWSK